MREGTKELWIGDKGRERRTDRWSDGDVIGGYPTVEGGETRDG